MKCKKITIFTSLDDIEDIFDENIDVGVELEDGRDYNLVVATHRNILTLMNDEKSDFLPPDYPMIIVKKLTREVVEKAIEAYAAEDEAYYLKLYGTSIDLETLDQIKDRQSAELDELLKEDE